MKILGLLLFCIAPLSLSAQTVDENIESALNHIYNVKFDSAEQKIRLIKQSEPKNPRSYFLSTLALWWKINVENKTEAYDEAFVESVEKVSEISDEALDKNENDAQAMFYKGSALGLQGLLRSFRESWLKAAQDGSRAVSLLQKAVDIDPSNKDALLGLGIYNYFAEYVPERYPVVKPLLILFPKGDKNKGLTQIQDAALSSSFAKTEAEFILTYLNLKYQQNYGEAEAHAKKLLEKHPNHPVFEKYLGEAYLRGGKLNEALRLWEGYIKKSEQGFAGYANISSRIEGAYNLSVTYSKMRQIDKAEPFLLKVLELQNGNNNNSMGSFTYLMLGWVSDMKGDRNKAINHYNKVLEMDNNSGVHKEAEKYKISPYIQ